MRIIGLLNLRDNFGQQIAIINRFRAQTLLLAGFNILKISVVKAHRVARFSLVFLSGFDLMRRSP